MASPMDADGSSKALLEKLADWKLLFQERNEFLKALIEENKDLKNRVNKMTTYNEGSDSLISMIIDGDGALFNDNYCAKGDKGGVEAAHQLQTQIQDFIKNKDPEIYRGRLCIFVFMVINMAGMACAAEQYGLLSTKHALTSFMRSFGSTQPLFMVVDVSIGKKRADQKCRKLFDAMIRLPECKHVIFGPCHDTGYVTDLESYRRYVSKITLLETTPAHGNFLELGYEITAFPDVFRSDPLGHTNPAPEDGRSPSPWGISTPESSTTDGKSAPSSTYTHL